MKVFYLSQMHGKQGDRLGDIQAYLQTGLGMSGQLAALL